MRRSASGASVRDMTRTTTDRGRSSFSHTFVVVVVVVVVVFCGGVGGRGEEGRRAVLSHCTLNNYDVHE